MWPTRQTYSFSCPCAGLHSARRANAASRSSGSKNSNEAMRSSREAHVFAHLLAPIPRQRTAEMLLWSGSIPLPYGAELPRLRSSPLSRVVAIFDKDCHYS